ncbi:hypothetical protein ACIA8R_42405 [Nonomuraea sp. NPDC051191]
MPTRNRLAHITARTAHPSEACTTLHGRLAWALPAKRTQDQQ